jgi:peptidoglycan/LPS O-acetylase OafA/YrhL
MPEGDTPGAGEEPFARPRAPRLVVFDVWRIVAIALVVGVHLLQKYQSPLGNAFGIEGLYSVTLGGVGVTLFLILSGALLEYHYGRTPQPYLQFVWRRLARIYPTYWLSIVFSIVALGALVPWPRTVLETLLDYTGFLPFAGYPWSAMIVSTGWFVGVIVSLYLMFPLVSRAIRAWRGSILVFLLISLVARQLAFRYIPGTRPMDWFPLCRLFEFSLGVWMLQSERQMSALARIGQGLGETARRRLAHASNLAFPVYLIHRAALAWIPIYRLPVWAFLPAFALVTLVLSEAIYRLADMAEQPLRRLAG